MWKLIMLCGISGSGKTKYAKQIAKAEGAAIVRPEELRHTHIFGRSGRIRNLKLSPGTKRTIIDAFRKNGTVIIDAPNLFYKSRKSVLTQLLSEVDFGAECRVLLKRPEECAEYIRACGYDCSVDEIMRELRRFELPNPFEHFTQGVVFVNTSAVPTDMEAEYSRLSGLTQTGRYHLENADNHSRMVEDMARTLGTSATFIRAARYHDVGKAYTKTVDNEGICHFSGHENVSAYLYALSIGHRSFTEDEIYCLRLIQFHDIIYKDPSRFASLPHGLKADLTLFHQCDMYGAIVPEELFTVSLRQFIMAFDDWKERLSQKPFSLSFSQADNIFTFKSDQSSSDYSIAAVKEADNVSIRFTDGIPQYVKSP